MLTNLQTWTIVGIAAALWLALSVVGKVDGGLNSIWDLADLIPVLLVGASLFERWGWRWQRLHPHLVGTPVARGTWRGELRSSFPDRTTGEPIVKAVYLAIEQTLTTVSVRMLTNESASDQIVGSVCRAPNGVWVVGYTYFNMPEQPLRKDSPPHLGGAALKVFGEPPDRIDGEYWTDRDTKGTFNMTSRMPAVAQSFAQAEALPWDGDG